MPEVWFDIDNILSCQYATWATSKKLTLVEHVGISSYLVQIDSQSL